MAILKMWGTTYRIKIFCIKPYKTEDFRWLSCFYHNIYIYIYIYTSTHTYTQKGKIVLLWDRFYSSNNGRFYNRDQKNSFQCNQKIKLINS